jgi:hypothetical protein
VNRTSVTNGFRICFSFVALVLSDLFLASTKAEGLNLEAFQVFEDHREEILTADSIIEISGFAMFKVIVREAVGDGRIVTKEKAAEMLIALNAYALRLCGERGQRLSAANPINFQQVPFQQVYLKSSKDIQVFVFSTEAALLDRSLILACEGAINI